MCFQLELTTTLMKLTLHRALYLQRQLVIRCCFDLLLLESIFVKCKLCFFDQDVSDSVFISIRYTKTKTNTVIHFAGPQGYPLLSANIGVSLLHLLIVASLRTNQIYIKIDKLK